MPLQEGIWVWRSAGAPWHWRRCCFSTTLHLELGLGWAPAGSTEGDGLVLPQDSAGKWDLSFSIGMPFPLKSMATCSCYTPYTSGLSDARGPLSQWQYKPYPDPWSKQLTRLPSTTGSLHPCLARLLEQTPQAGLWYAPCTPLVDTNACLSPSHTTQELMCLGMLTGTFSMLHTPNFHLQSGEAPLTFS